MRKRNSIISCVVLFLVYQHSFGQPQSSQTDLIQHSLSSGSTCPGITSPLPDAEAQDRRDFFKIKKSILNNMGISANDFSFQAKTLDDVLKKFNSPPGKYDGVRIYFAVSDKAATAPYDKNTMYLILIPTTNSGTADEDGLPISEDDESNAYITDGTGSLNPVDLTKPQNAFVIKWENRYLNKVAPRIERRFEKLLGIKLNEAHSLWFSAAVMFSGGYDLLSNLENADCKIQSVNFDLASWTLSTPTEYAFEMDLVYEIVTKTGTHSFVTLATPEILKKMGSDFVNSNKDAYGDTGIPCPPAKCP